MANYSKPQSDNLPNLSDVATPVKYSTPEGLALLLSDISVSGSKVTPYLRGVPTSEFKSGVYNFPTPDGFGTQPYTLPMLEPLSWAVYTDTIAAYRPVMVYRVGNPQYVDEAGRTVPADIMSGTFPIKIQASPYTIDTQKISPFGVNQSVIIYIYKASGANINWTSSNIENNGLTDAAIASATELAFVATNILGTYRVTQWLSPDFVSSNLSTLTTSNKSSLAGVVNEVYAEAKKSKTPIGSAGGDLTGAYPNPTIKTGAVNSDKIASGAVITSKIADGQVTEAKIASSAVTGAKIANAAVTGAKIADRTITGVKIGLKGIYRTNLADGSVDNGVIVNNAVDRYKIKDNSVLPSKMAPEVVYGKMLYIGPKYIDINASASFTIGALKANDVLLVAGDLVAGQTAIPDQTINAIVPKGAIDTGANIFFAAAGTTRVSLRVSFNGSALTLTSSTAGVSAGNIVIRNIILLTSN